MTRVAGLALTLALLAAAPAAAQKIGVGSYGKAPMPGETGPPAPENVGYDQKLGGRVPLDVELTEVVPTGLAGEVTRDDVIRHAKQAGVFRNIETPEWGDVRRETIPVKGVRKAIATAMTTSKFTAPHVSLFVDVDATRTPGGRATVVIVILRGQGQGTLGSPTYPLLSSLFSLLSVHPNSPRVSRPPRHKGPAVTRPPPPLGMSWVSSSRS